VLWAVLAERAAVAWPGACVWGWWWVPRGAGGGPGGGGGGGWGGVGGVGAGLGGLGFEMVGLDMQGLGRRRAGDGVCEGRLESMGSKRRGRNGASAR